MTEDLPVSPPPLVRWVDRFLSFWIYPVFRTSWGLPLLFVMVVAICVARSAVSLLGSQAFTTDAFMLFDGAWRMICGQKPHIDFYSHVGLLTYAPTIVGLWLSHGTAYGFGYAQALVAWLLSAWIFAVGKGRLSDVPLFLLCLSAVLTAAAPFAIGFGPLNMGPGMVYNRYGYVLLAIILVEAFSERRTDRKYLEFWGGLSTGAAIAVCLFMKITYFVDGVFLLIALLWWRRQTRARWAGLVSGFLLVSLPCCCYYGFNLVPFVRDMMIVAAGKQIPWRTYLLDGMARDAALVVVFACLAGLVFVSQRRLRQARMILLVGIAVSVAGLLAIMGNHEYTGFPLSAFFALLVIDGVNRSRENEVLEPSLLRVAAILPGAVFILSLLFGQGLGVAYGLLDRYWLAKSSLPIESPVLAGLTFTADDKGYVDFYNDGLSLLRQYSKPSESVMSLDFSNPFSYALERRPARGGATVLQYRTTFGDKGHPSPEWLIGYADLVLVPNTFSDGSLRIGIPKLYGPYLASHFKEVVRTKHWQLYRRFRDIAG